MEYIKQCIEQGRLDVISDFINTLSDINAVLISDDDCNLNLLHFATGVDSVFRDEVIELILEDYDVDINKHSGPGNDYFTAAHIAACYGYSTTLKLLFLNGADPYLMDKENNTVWDIASLHNNFNCILVIENEVNKPMVPSPKKEIENSIYYSLSALNLENENENDETIKSLDDQSIIHIKTVFNNRIVKVEEKLLTRSPSSPRSIPLKVPTPKNSPSRQIPSVKTPTKIPLKTPTNTPTKSTNKKCTPKDVPFKKGPPKKISPRKERKPKITQVINLNETIYTDSDFNVTLIEPCEDDSEFGPIDPSLLKLTDQEIRQHLMRLGQSPGPVNQTTRTVYLRRLETLKSATITPNSPSKTQLSPFKPLLSYPPYINAILLDQFRFDEAKKLEQEFTDTFSNSKGPKDFFNYLLIDPRPSESDKQSNDKIESNPFVKFIKSIFYIGKGKNNRPFMHLYEAAAPAKNNKPISDKVKRITEIWDQGFGVISHPLATSISADEAYARESCMIDAIGIDKLTNIKLGQRKINSIVWSTQKRLTLGTYLIHNGFMSLAIHGGRPIRRADVS